MTETRALQAIPTSRASEQMAESSSGFGTARSTVSAAHVGFVADG